jgi:hypothetical protein
MGYIEFMADEYPEVSDANFAYIVKRATSFDALSDREKEVLREYFVSNLPARKRSRIDPGTFDSMVQKLYEGEEQVSIVDLIKALDDITRFVTGYSTTDVEQDPPDLAVIEEIDYAIVAENLEEYRSQIK